MWLAPTIPALLRNDHTCITGSVLESMFVQDGLGYNNHTRNKWAALFHRAGAYHPIYNHSEFLNAKILDGSDLLQDVCGDFVSVWGSSFKSLRKAVYAAGLDPEFGLDHLGSLERGGLRITDFSRFSEQTKMPNSLGAATRLLPTELESETLTTLRAAEAYFDGPWATKAYPLENAPLGLPAYFQSRLRAEWGRLNIPEMSDADLAELESYSFRDSIQGKLYRG